MCDPIYQLVPVFLLLDLSILSINVSLNILNLSMDLLVNHYNYPLLILLSYSPNKLVFVKSRKR